MSRMKVLRNLELWSWTSKLKKPKVGCYYRVIPLFKDVNPDSDKNYKFYFQYFEILCDVYTRIPCVRQIVNEITNRRGSWISIAWLDKLEKMQPSDLYPTSRMTQLWHIQWLLSLFEWRYAFVNKVEIDSTDVSKIHTFYFFC